jgi:nucleoside-diphosphate-sugar epimerase
MKKKVIVVTGAAGFLGSAITVDLSGDHHLLALDRRKPTDALLVAAPEVIWHQLDIADPQTLASVFHRTKQSFGRIDVVVHFAAFYHFGADWRPEYGRTNVEGTSNVLRSAKENGAQRMIFASSIAAMQPGSPDGALTERTPTTGYIPYAKSKSIGERMVLEASNYLPVIVLRIGGVFSDWCELPPLYSLIRLWMGRWPLNRLVVGRGTSGMPYIHRNDVVRIVRSCIDAYEALGSHEVFLASQPGTVLHKDLFAVVRQPHSSGADSVPTFVAPELAKFGLYVRHALGSLTGDLPFEHPWMLKYVDRPWVVDTTYTRNTLGWSCTEGMGVLDRLPRMLEHFQQDRRTWRHRNSIRNRGQYAYYG